MSTIIVIGQKGTPSSPDGGSALAQNTGSPDPKNSAIAKGGAGVEGENGAGGAGGYANGVATTKANTVSDVSASVFAAGGAGGYIGKYAGYSGAAGSAAGYAYATNASTSITNVSASATLMGGAGGAAAPYDMGGEGGIVLRPGPQNPQFGAFARNAGAGTATATVNAKGGAGGATQFNFGGTGGSVSLNNAVGGRTMGGTLNLMQDATGGDGGSSFGYETTGGGGTGGAGGNATSLLGVTDTSSLGVSLKVAATAGKGGRAQNGAFVSATGGDGGAGGTAIARSAINGIGSVASTVTATGGSSGYNTHDTGSAGIALATAIATTIGATRNATAIANDIGGTGGNGVFINMFTFGNGGNGAGAYAATAFASSLAGNAKAEANATGGSGGYSPFNSGGAGGNASLINAVSASSVTGGITLVQTATGGSGGSNGAGGMVDGGAGGNAYSSLTTTTSTIGNVNATVNATGGAAGYGRKGSYGGNAAARLNIIAAGNISSNVTALGGNGNIQSLSAYGGSATAYDIATASGVRGSVFAKSTANAGYGLSLYTVASATSIADASRSTGNATAISAAGYGGKDQYISAASARSTAITANGKTAIAEASSDNTFSGLADATATTSDGIIDNLTAVADAPVSTSGGGQSETDAGTAQAEVDGGTAYTPSMGTYDSYAFAGGLAAYKNVGPSIAAIFHSAATQGFGTGALGYNVDPNESSLQTYSSSITWSLNQSTLAGDTLDLGLLYAIAKGDNFSSVTFKVTVQGSSVINETFTSPVQAAIYFTGNALSLGPIKGGTSPLNVTVSFAVTSTGDVADGYGINFMLGATRPLYPPVITAPVSASLAAGQALAISGFSLAEQSIASSETFTVDLSDKFGLLAAKGSGVTGAGTDRLTITGSLAQVNADLATVIDTSLTAGADTITLTARDSLGSAAVSEAVAVTVNGAIGSGDYIFVFSGETSENLSFSNGASEVVESNGFAHNSVLNAFSLQLVLAGGLTAGTRVNMNGEQLVQGTASRTTIYGKQIVESGGTSVGSTVKFGAFENVLPGGTAQNTTIGASGTLYLANGANATGAIIFFGSNGVLQIAGAALPSAPISNFDINNSTGDEITLTGFTYAAAHDSVTLGAGNVLMLNLNGVSKDLYLNPSQNYNHDSFSIKTNTQDQVVVFGSLATAQPMVFLSRDSGAIPATPITDLRNLFSDIRTAGSASATLPPSILVGFPNKLETQTFSGIASILADLRMQQTPLTAAAKLLAHHG